MNGGTELRQNNNNNNNKIKNKPGLSGNQKWLEWLRGHFDKWNWNRGV